MLLYPDSSIDTVERRRHSKHKMGGSWSMATCPACNHDVATPFFLNLDAWRWLVCPHCKTRLEIKPPRSVVLGPLMVSLFVLARRATSSRSLRSSLCLQPSSSCYWKASALKCSSGKSPCPSPPSG